MKKPLTLRQRQALFRMVRSFIRSKTPKEANPCTGLPCFAAMDAINKLQQDDNAARKINH